MLGLRFLLFVTFSEYLCEEGHKCRDNAHYNYIHPRYSNFGMSRVLGKEKARTFTFKDLFTIEIQSWEYFTISGQLLIARVDRCCSPRMAGQLRALPRYPVSSSKSSPAIAALYLGNLSEISCKWAQI